MSCLAAPVQHHSMRIALCSAFLVQFSTACNRTATCDCGRGSYRIDGGECQLCFSAKSLFGFKGGADCAQCVILVLLIFCIAVCFCSSNLFEWWTVRETIVLPPLWREEGRKDHMYQGSARGSPRLWITPAELESATEERGAPAPRV